MAGGVRGCAAAVSEIAGVAGVVGVTTLCGGSGAGGTAACAAPEEAVASRCDAGGGWGLDGVKGGAVGVRLDVEACISVFGLWAFDSGQDPIGSP